MVLPSAWLFHPFLSLSHMVGNSLAPFGWTSESDIAPGTENFLGALSHGLALLAVAFLLLCEALHEDPFQARGEPLSLFKASSHCL